MIKCIVAADEKRGIADDNGIPWQGKIPSDVAYYRELIKDGGTLLMGYGLYKELTKPYPGGINYVAMDFEKELKEGFEAVQDARKFIQETSGDVWNLGGAGLIESTFDLIDELYITQLEGDFNCSKFLPEYEDQFDKISESEPLTENGITFRFTVWKRK